VEALLKEGADVNKANNDGTSPLFVASCNGHCDVVEALLCGGADVNKARNDGMTPLIMASCNGHCDVVEALLRGGADVSGRNGLALVAIVSPLMLLGSIGRTLHLFWTTSTFYQ
jgi:ankyrin repeat protein